MTTILCIIDSIIGTSWVDGLDSQQFDRVKIIVTTSNVFNLYVWPEAYFTHIFVCSNWHLIFKSMTEIVITVCIPSPIMLYLFQGEIQYKIMRLIKECQTCALYQYMTPWMRILYAKNYTNWLDHLRFFFFYTLFFVVDMFFVWYNKNITLANIT